VGPASVVLCYLLSYNAVHFTLRLACFHVGYQRDFAALDWLRGLRIARLTGWVRNVSLVLMGCLGAACLQVPAQTYDGLERLAVTLGLFGLLFAGNRAVMSRISTTVLVYAVALAAIVVSHLL
jgi:mannose/fructose/N-acetylgalactosamine-specific phosphotransferase system component IID